MSSYLATRRALFILAACIAGSVLACAPKSAPPAASSTAAPVAGPDDLFVDVAAATGLDFVHFNGMSGEYYFSEMMGSGVALLDYDNDGDLDVYLLQGALLNPAKTLDQATFPPAGPRPPRHRLFRNDLAPGPDGKPRLHFVDVTAESGLDDTGYGMGVASGDFDGDGWVDLYVTRFGAPDRLWHNNGAGPDGRVTFADVTAAAGLGDPRWGVPAAFFDFDRDGDLDLFVGHYVDYAIATHKACVTELGQPNYCGPLAYTPLPDSLYENLGPGPGGQVTFADVTGRSGLGAAAPGGALGAIPADFNSDGWPDLYVANDGLPNHLWINHGRDAEGRVTFTEEALLAGAAVSADGQPQASMGVDAGDFDADGDEDIFMTHLTQETNVLYVNDGQAHFEEASTRTGLGAPSLQMTGFGTGFFDYDNDGRLDLLAVNGAVRVIPELALAGDPLPLHQPNQLFHNVGPDAGGRVRYAEVSAAAGAVFQLSEVSRGAAFGDLDNDGDTDVVLSNNSGPVRLLLNQHGQEAGWLGLRLLAREGGRDLLGAWVEVTPNAGEGVTATLDRRVRTSRSYASSSDPRLLFGLGELRSGSARVRVHWPDARGPQVEEWDEVAIGSYTTLVRGSGREVKP